MKYVIQIICIFLIGCSESTDNIKIHFENPTIVTDDAGNKFVVKHHLGNTYIIDPLLEPQKLK